MKNYIEETKKVLDKIDLAPLEEFVKLLKLVIGFKSIVFTAGAGGGNQLAGHLSEDLISFLLNNKIKPIRSLQLGLNAGLTSAISNDMSFERAYLEELKVLARKNKGDILVCFTGSGNSKVLLEPAKYAKLNGIAVVSFTGFDGGAIKDLSDINIHIPSNSWAIIHSLQSLLFHLVLEEIIK